MKKNRFQMILPVLLTGLLILYLLSLLSAPMKESILYSEVQKFYMLRTAELFLLILFGALIEFRKVMAVFRRGVVFHPILLVFAILILILLLLPVRLGLSAAGSSGVFSLVNQEGVRSILGILTGILLVRSVSDHAVERETILTEDALMRKPAK
ncbi:hypothetical protein ACHAL6_11340 [Proteiniclasticum sp. C24MP]|uniref:hypothetical protein n=1 Tax=Proteiniclasticum sp. C24MP TaxID=3374101 RepID=UPI0037543D70